MDDYNDYITGSYKGIGVEVAQHEQGLEVSNIFKDSPAEKQGLKPKDILTHLNGKKITEMSDEEKSSLLGTEGNEVTITVLREDGSTIDVVIKVEVIKKPTVFTSFYDTGIAYIQITQFDADTGKDFEDAITEVLKKNSKGLIVDLRNNGGGYESQATIVADILLPEGIIAYAEDKNGTKTKEIKSDKSEIEIPVVMLINQNSASASELVAGAFRDFKKGKLIGVKSFGKALGQISKTYESDGSGIVITTARYFTPSGQCIHGIGINPDIEVQLVDEFKDFSPEDIPFEFDTQLQKAIVELEKVM